MVHVLYILVFLSDIAQKVVSHCLELRLESELLENACTHVVEVFVRLKEPDDSHVASRLVKILKLAFVSTSEHHQFNSRLSSVTKYTLCDVFAQ